MVKKYLLLALLCLVVASCHKDEKKNAAEEMAGEEMPVAVALPEVKTVTLTQSFPGTLEARQEVELVARVDGVLKVMVPSGSKVRKGQLLYVIENRKYSDAVRQAQANIRDYESSYEYYKKQYASMQEAFKVDAVSEMELLQSKSNMDQAQANIQNAKAALDEAQTMLGYCSITAPFDGTIALQTYDQGSYINGEGATVKLNTIYNDDVVYAYISVDSKRYAQMLEDTRAQGLSLDSVKIDFNVPLQHQYTSKLNYMAPDVSTSTGTVTLRFEIDNKYGELKSGMYLKVEVPYAVADNALIIRDASIGSDQQGKYVYIVNDSNRVVYTPVEVGELYMDTLRIVDKGMTSDSRYITEALLKVRDGMKVKPIL